MSRGADTLQHVPAIRGDIESIPQVVLDNAAHKVYALLRDEQGVNITWQEAHALLVCLAPWSSDAGRYLDRLT